MEYNDITIECVTCSTPFVWTAGAQEFYERKGLQRPRRCATCRDERKRAREAPGVGAVADAVERAQDDAG